MKKLFTLLLACCATYAFAYAPPVFEEAEEDGDDTECSIFAPIPFASNESFFEEVDEDQDSNNECDECDNDECQDDGSNVTMDDDEEEDDEIAQYNSQDEVIDNFDIRCTAFGNTKDELSFGQWGRYKANFGLEKLFLRFPAKPTITQSNSLLTAYAYDYAVMYSFNGYFPPVGNIDPIVWFDQILYNYDVTRYPYNLISHEIFQADNGDWIMDYVVHDYGQGFIIKARAVVTPYNGYTLQCVKPIGAKDFFDYFLENLFLKCEYQD